MGFVVCVGNGVVFWEGAWAGKSGNSSPDGAGDLLCSNSAALPLLHLLGQLDFPPSLLPTGRCEKLFKYSGFWNMGLTSSLFPCSAVGWWLLSLWHCEGPGCRAAPLCHWVML